MPVNRFDVLLSSIKAGFEIELAFSGNHVTLLNFIAKLRSKGLLPSRPSDLENIYDSSANYFNAIFTEIFPEEIEQITTEISPQCLEVVTFPHTLIYWKTNTHIINHIFYTLASYQFENFISCHISLDTEIFLDTQHLQNFFRWCIFNHDKIQEISNRTGHRSLYGSVLRDYGYVDFTEMADEEANEMYKKIMDDLDRTVYLNEDDGYHLEAFGCRIYHNRLEIKWFNYTDFDYMLDVCFLLVCIIHFNNDDLEYRQMFEEFYENQISQYTDYKNLFSKEEESE